MKDESVIRIVSEKTLPIAFKHAIAGLAFGVFVMFGVVGSVKVMEIYYDLDSPQAEEE